MLSILPVISAVLLLFNKLGKAQVAKTLVILCLLFVLFRPPAAGFRQRRAYLLAGVPPLLRGACD